MRQGTAVCWIATKKRKSRPACFFLSANSHSFNASISSLSPSPATARRAPAIAVSRNTHSNEQESLNRTNMEATQEHVSVGCNRLTQALAWGADGLAAFGAHHSVAFYYPMVTLPAMQTHLSFGLLPCLALPTFVV